VPPRPAQGAPSNDKIPEPVDHGVGRSRGGLTTKIHLLADRRCRPVARVTTAGQRHDSLAFEPLMDRLRIARAGPGHPRTRPGRLLGDKAYSSKKIRAHLRRRRITATIPEPADQIAHRVKRGRKGGRPPAFDAVAYKDRNTTETSKPQCCHNRGWPASLLAPSCLVFMSAA
jgi:hypothetical protein